MCGGAHLLCCENNGCIVPLYIYIYIYIYIIQIYSGITCGRVLNGELYTCKLYKLINLCWSTGCFVKLHFTKQPVDQHRLINLHNLHVYIFTLLSFGYIYKRTSGVPSAGVAIEPLW